MAGREVRIIRSFFFFKIREIETEQYFCILIELFREKMKISMMQGGCGTVEVMSLNMRERSGSKCRGWLWKGRDLGIRVRQHHRARENRQMLHRIA